MTYTISIATDVFAALFVLCQLRFALLMLVTRQVQAVPSAPMPTGSVPKVALQIATYREAETIPPLLEAIACLDWPRDQLRVQVLDDSPPADAQRMQAVIDEFAAKGLPIECCRRGSREGFKAGALNHGLVVAGDAEFIAYFDADCRPAPQFLQRTLPYFTDPEVAAVQARWRFPNSRLSALTILQSAAFEYLFAYDMEVRARLKLPTYYLGSAAVWRKSVPIELEGWRYQPFTAEDVDMGLRAGNAGWKIDYVNEILADDDAVEDILAFRTQQRRWAQAVLQAGISSLRSLPRSMSCPVAKLMDWTSLLPHALIPITLLLTISFAAWMLWLEAPMPKAFWIISVMFAISPATLAIANSQRILHDQDWLRRMRQLLRAGPYLAATMSSFLFGFRDLFCSGELEFVSTPKVGKAGVVRGLKRAWIATHVAPLLLDAVLAALFLIAAAVAISSSMLSVLLPLAMMGLNFMLSTLLTGAALFKRIRMQWSEKATA